MVRSEQERRESEGGGGDGRIIRSGWRGKGSSSHRRLVVDTFVTSGLRLIGYCTPLTLEIRSSVVVDSDHSTSS